MCVSDKTYRLGLNITHTNSICTKKSINTHMKITSKSVVFLLCLGLANLGFSQNDFFFNHYMFNPSYYNPAWVGMEDKAFVAAHHRTQWAGYNATFDPGGAPTTQLISLAIPLDKTLSGVGASVVNDRLPGLRSNQVRFQASVKKSFRAGEISLGVSPSINIQTLDPGDFRSRDPEVFGTKQSQMRPNLHAGLYYQSLKRYTIGVSVENILEPQFNLNGFDQLDYFKRSINLLGVYEFGLTRDIIVRPSFLLRSLLTDFTGYSLDISAVATYQEKMWGGLAFKTSESISVLLGYSFLEGNKLKAGYSFDYIVSEQDAKEPTSHEIFIRYDLPSLVLGGRKAVKTPRFTF